MQRDLSERLADNILQLRNARGLSQQHMAKLAGIPRATWANLETGSANPTLEVLARVATALQVNLEELVGPARSGGRLYPSGTLPVRTQGGAVVQRLLPDRIPGVVMERMTLPAGGRLVGVPHTAGTREYLTCESGRLALTASEQTWQLAPGDVLVFRGDQKHSYQNSGRGQAVGYSVVLLQPVL